MSFGSPSSPDRYMIDIEILRKRIEHGEEYLLALEELLDSEWNEIFAAHSEGKLRLPQSMVLLHPSFYKERERETGIAAIRGTRRFTRDAGPGHTNCMADQIWLSSCPLEKPGALHSDHLFPYSLGGPTLAANQLFLCPVHNRSKTNDVHLFPWEKGEPSWLAEQVDRIRRLIL